jgi:hypothetical protein
MDEQIKKEEKKQLAPGDIVVLNYTPEDLECEDLGMSGIVLQSVLEKFKLWLDSKYLYIGHLQDRPDRVILERLKDDTYLSKTGNIYMTLSNYIKKVEDD